MKVSDRIALWALIVSLFLGMLAFIRDCSQDKKIEENNYITKALQFRPRLEILDNPRVSAIDTFVVSEASQIGDTLVTKFSLSIICSLNVANKGESMARIYATAWTDTSTGIAKIRDVLLDKKYREDFFKSLPVNDYYPLKEVQSGDTTYFKIRHTIQYVNGNQFTIHFLLLYKNEAGNLFDTYYWARYATTPITGVPQFKVENGKLIFNSIKFAKADFREFLKLTDSNTSTQTYSREQAKDILNFLKRKWNNK